MKNNTEDTHTPPSTARENISSIRCKLDTYIERMKKYEVQSDQENLCHEIIHEIRMKKDIIVLRSNNEKNLLEVVAELNKNIMTNYLVNKILEQNRNVIFLVDKKGNSALMYAAISGNTVFLEEAKSFILNSEKIIKNNDNETAFILAAKNNKIDFLKEMFDIENFSLEKNKKFNISTKEKELSLLIAAEHGHADIVDLLISKGVDINKKNTDDKTPLMLAIENNHYKVISIIRKKSSITRISFTAACFYKMMAEWISLYQKRYPKPVVLLEKPAVFIIKPLMYVGYSVISAIEEFFPTVKCYNNLSQYIPHPIENYVVTSQREKYFIDYFYGTSSDRTLTPEHLSLRSTNDPQPEFGMNYNNNSLTSIRNREQLSVVAESMGRNTNGSEHYMSSSSEMSASNAENINTYTEFETDNSINDKKLQEELIKSKIEYDKAKAKQILAQAAVAESHLHKIRNIGLEQPSPMRQETSSTRSEITSRPASVPRINLARLPSTRSTSSNQLPQSLSVFPESSSSAPSHQSRHQDRNNPQIPAFHSLSHVGT